MVQGLRRPLGSQSAILPFAAFDLCRLSLSVRVSKQMESAMGKDGLGPLQFDFRSVEHERSRY